MLPAKLPCPPPISLALASAMVSLPLKRVPWRCRPRMAWPLKPRLPARRSKLASRLASAANPAKGACGVARRGARRLRRQIGIDIQLIDGEADAEAGLRARGAIGQRGREAALD